MYTSRFIWRWRTFLPRYEGCGVYLFVKVDEDKIHMNRHRWSTLSLNFIRVKMKKTQSGNQSEFLWERQQWCSLVCGEWQGVGARENRGEGRARENCKMLIFVILKRSNAFKSKNPKCYLTCISHFFESSGPTSKKKIRLWIEGNPFMVVTVMGHEKLSPKLSKKYE